MTCWFSIRPLNFRRTHILPIIAALKVINSSSFIQEEFLLVHHALGDAKYKFKFIIIGELTERNLRKIA